jgi:hypothetical protein
VTGPRGNLEMARNNHLDGDRITFLESSQQHKYLFSNFSLNTAGLDYPRDSISVSLRRERTTRGHKHFAGTLLW